MKTLKITLLSCLFAVSAIAQNIITIDNSSQSTTVNRTLQAALDAATAGDTIYMQPSGISYGAGIIDKAITIVGRSHSERTLQSTAGNITISSSGVIIKGISFPRLTTALGTLPAPYVGLRLYECRITNSVTLGVSTSSVNPPILLDDVEIQGCVVGPFDQRTDAQNILIGNNIITGSFAVRAPASVIISNNIFRSGGNGNFRLTNTSTSETAIFFNNIFKANSNTDRTIELSTGAFNFSNSLTYNYGDGNLTFGTIGTGTFLENNSLLNTDPLFVDVDASITTSFAGASPTYTPSIRIMDNLRLQTISPALTAGSNEDEIGLFSSGFNYDHLGNPRDVPTLDIINFDAAVPINGTINVTIKAVAH